MVPLKRKGNTRVSEQSGFTVVRLHSTDVVKFNNSFIVLNSGGWRTATTKARMNQASQEFGLGFYVYQKDYRWYVKQGNDTAVEFSDGMALQRR